MLVNDLPFSTAESPLFHDLLLSTRSMPTWTDAAPAFSIPDPNNPQCNITHKELELFLSKRSAVELMDVYNDKPPNPHSSAQLIIHFTDAASQAAACCRNLHSRNHSDFASATESAAYVASVFRYVSASHLSYLFSKNCRLNFSSSLAQMVQEAQQQCDIKCEQIVVSRPLVAVDKPRAIPKSAPDLVWVPDVAREVGILCQELLAKIPLLIRVQRRNNILSAYFREDYSNAVSEELFGRDDDEKEKFQRYLQFIAKRAQSFEFCQVVEVASHTHDLICKAQDIHEDGKRVVDTRNFINTLTEEKCGNVPLTQEVIRLVLSSNYRDDLKAFLALMKPLTALISLYSISHEAPSITYSNPFYDVGDLFRCPLVFCSRSLAHVLSDCVGTLRELYSEKLPDYEDDLRSLRGHVACRLLGKGVDGCPPVADDISHMAALLNPDGDLSNTKGITVDEVWKRAVQYVQAHHSDHGEQGVKMVLDQLQEFQKRSGRFADESMFRETSPGADPLAWWEKCGHVTPELRSIALSVLSVPTTAFAAVRHMTNFNACNEDLQRPEGDGEMEKKRLITWNLRLCMSRVKAEEKEGGATDRDPRETRFKTERVLL
ncbi:Ribonuclease H-like protein [Gracilaria domingensis]|nr:Ribonuclease H-like protein [Gracilaria domingensis]